MVLQGIFTENKEDEGEDKMKSIKQRLIDKEILFYDVHRKHYNELTEEDIDYIVELRPWYAAEYLNQHPFFTQKHDDYIKTSHPWSDATNTLDTPKQKEKKNMTKTLSELVDKFSTDIEKFKQDLPFNYWRGFGSRNEFFDVLGNQIQLTKEGDYMTAEEWIPVLEFWLQQMKGMTND